MATFELAVVRHCRKSCPPIALRKLSLSEQSGAFGKDAARYGTAALSQISKETGQRPLIAIAVALGVGILIGMATRSRA
jgi:hypothetical protein